MSGRYTTDYRQDMRLLRTRPQRVIAALVVVAAIATPFLLSMPITPPFGLPWARWFTTINLALMAALGAAAFNLLLGYTHQISVAHAAFLMLGSMVGAWLGQIWGVSFFLVLPAAAIAGALVGTIVGLPALRFRGLYLLIATFGVHFFALLAYRQFQTRFFGFHAIRYEPPEIPAWLHWLPFITPGADGRFLITGNFRWYWTILPIVTLGILFMVNVVRTREGRAFRAVAERDIAAALIGVNVTKSKLLAFAVSSAFVSVTGVLTSYFLGARGEDSFPFEVVLHYAIIIIVGGFSSIQGAVFGAFFFYMMPVIFDWARAELPLIRGIAFLDAYRSEVNLGFFGLLVVIVLVLRPAGLSGIWQGIKGYFARWPYST